MYTDQPGGYSSSGESWGSELRSVSSITVSPSSKSLRSVSSSDRTVGFLSARWSSGTSMNMSIERDFGGASIMSPVEGVTEADTTATAGAVPEAFPGVVLAVVFVAVAFVAVTFALVLAVPVLIWAGTDAEIGTP